MTSSGRVGGGKPVPQVQLDRVLLAEVPHPRRVLPAARLATAVEERHRLVRLAAAALPPRRRVQEPGGDGARRVRREERVRPQQIALDERERVLRVRGGEGLCLGGGGCARHGEDVHYSGRGSGGGRGRGRGRRSVRRRAKQRGYDGLPLLAPRAEDENVAHAHGERGSLLSFSAYR